MNVLSPEGYFLWIFYLNGIMQYVTCCVWLLSLSLMFLRFIHSIVCTRLHWLLWLNDIPFYVYATICLLIHSWMDLRAIFTSWLLWVVPLWTGMHMRFLKIYFQVLGDWNWRIMVFLFQFLRYCQTVFFLLGFWLWLGWIYRMVWWYITMLSLLLHKIDISQFISILITLIKVS